jgi:hypothetical protein
MGDKQVYRFFRAIVRTKRTEGDGYPRPSALTTALSRRSGRSSALPYPPLERRDFTMLACFCHWTVFRCEFLTFKLLRWLVFRD